MKVLRRVHSAGMVHRNRKERGEKDCVVYGLITNGCHFAFYMIDNNSKVIIIHSVTTSKDCCPFLKPC